MDDSTIMPGNPVRASDGHLGIVERVVSGPGGITLEALVVRVDPAGDRYRIPATLIEDTRRDDGQDVVYLAAARRGLERYRIHEANVGDVHHDEPTQITHYTATPQQAGGGIIERLQAGLGSLTSGVRDALEGHMPERRDHADDQEALRVPVVEEEIITGTEPVRTGTLRVRKTVETEQQTVTVSVTHEEPEVEFVEVDDYDPKAPYHPGETYIPIMGEQIVVEKRQVITGYLRVRKHAVAEDQQVTETVRKERLSVEREVYPSGQ